MVRIAIIGDFNPAMPSHLATTNALVHSSRLLQEPVYYEWILTELIDSNFKLITETYSGFLIAPGSPYKNMAGVLKIIEYARLHNVATLGTCGGFQHMVIEFARNVLNIKDAEHAESNPYASHLVVTPLMCHLKNQKLEITITDKQSKAFAIFEKERIEGQYYCNFGLNPEYQREIDRGGFKVVGSDASNEARILELKDHKFFIATLFIPQMLSTPTQPHQLISAFLSNAQ